MGKREAEIKVTGNTAEAEASIKDLENSTKKSFNQMSADAERESKEVSDAFKKSGLRMEKDIKKSSEDARKRYKKIKESGTASANDIKRAHIAMTQRIKRNNKELSTGASLVAKGFAVMRRNILAVTLAATGLAFGLKRAFDFAESAAKIRTQQVAFNNFTNSLGEDGDRILKKLQEISKGTIASADLITSAGTALLLGLDPSKIVSLLEIARASSKLTGESITKQFEDIAKGTGRASRLILDNLGIMFSQEEANKRMAAALKKTVEQLTDAEVKQGNLNEVIRQGGPIIKGVGADYVSQADTLARLRAKMTDYINAIGILTLKAIPFLETAFLKLRRSQLLLQRDIFETLPLVAKFTDLIGLTKNASASTTDAIDTLTKEITGLDTKIADVAKSTAELEANQNNLARTSADVAKGIQERIDLRSEEIAAAEHGQVVLMNALLAIEIAQKAANESVKEAIKATRKELNELLRDAERSKSFTASIFEEIERSRRVQFQQDEGFNVIQKLLNDLKFAEADFAKAAEERAAGNLEAARKLTLAAVRAASEVLETPEKELKGSGVSSIALGQAKVAAEELQEAAKGFALEMEKAANEKIPLVTAQLTSLEDQLKLGKATLKGIADEIKNDITLAQQLKDKLKEDTIATHTQIINTVEAKSQGGPVGQVLKLARGGRVSGGYGGGDKIHALLEPGEHVIKKESVAKLGRPAANAFNAGDIGQLLASLPVNQKLQDGGEVTGDSVNVNLLMEETQKAFPLTAKKTVADELVSEIKIINIIRSRKPNPY